MRRCSDRLLIEDIVAIEFDRVRLRAARRRDIDREHVSAKRRSEIRRDVDRAFVACLAEADRLAVPSQVATLPLTERQ